MKEEEFVWEHFKFNAEQRLKGFNFFVLLSIFADGGVFTGLEKELAPLLIVMLGIFITILAIVFFLVDARSQELLDLTIPALKKIEENFSVEAQLFRNDHEEKGRFVRYTFAFRMLLLCQLLFGVGVCVYGFTQWVLTILRSVVIP